MVYRKPLIAVIDDEKDIVDLYVELFQDRYDVHPYLSAFDFLEALDSGDLPGLVLVISDYSMPKMSGLEMIKNLHDRGCTAATLLLSGYIDKGVAMKALNFGINKVLEKPASPELIFETAASLIKECRLQSIEQKMMMVSDQLSELYVLYRDLLMPEIKNHSAGVVTIEDQGAARDISMQSPLELVANLEKSLSHLQMEKRLIKQDAI